MRILAVALLLGASRLFAADAPSYLSRNGSFALTVPAPYEPRSVPRVGLDIVGWERAGDHSVAGAVWRMNHQVFDRFSGSAEDAAAFLRSTHMCGDRVCRSTRLRGEPLGGDGVLYYYELRDPSVPPDRGVLSGIARTGGEFYRVQGVNYDPARPSRAEFLRILRSLRPAPAEDARPVPVPPGDGDVSDWGIRFSGESDLSLMQDSRSSRPAPVSPPAARRRARVVAKRRAPPKPAVRAPVPAETMPAAPPAPFHEDPPAPAGKLYEDPDDVLQHDALPDLIEMLRHANPRVRARAADILGQRGESAAAAVPRLMGNLDDKDDRARSSAALALGNIGAPARAAIPKLKTLLHDRNADARMSARDALERLEAP